MVVYTRTNDSSAVVQGSWTMASIRLACVVDDSRDACDVSAVRSGSSSVVCKGVDDELAGRI